MSIKRGRVNSLWLVVNRNETGQFDLSVTLILIMACLTLSHIQMLSEASFENAVTKREIARFFATVFSTLFNYYTTIYRDLAIFANIFSKSSSADLLYTGKG